MFQAIKRTFQKYSKRKGVQKIRLGICAMDKKAKSKPMKEILSRLPDELFEIIIFGDDCILNQPIENWPEVEVLIAFYSTKFPSQKALEYVKLRKPFMVNDLEMDAVLKDRRKVYSILQREGIDVPFHVVCDRDDPNIQNKIEEFDEYIIVNGVKIKKPLVEKPVDAENHNIYIYYPMSAGGGSKRLFRKVDDRSSEFYPNVNDLRREGSYIYEEFLVTQGTDVKVYTVGPDYGHAEARKSPVVDGRVNRDPSGLEVRFPVILSHAEKEIARKIVHAFKQTVCGFDILRVPNRSYCCDVNGFSFVKNSRKYYDDASQVLVELMITKVRSDLCLTPSTRAPLVRPIERTRENNIVQMPTLERHQSWGHFNMISSSSNKVIPSSIPETADVGFASLGSSHGSMAFTRTTTPVLFLNGDEQPSSSSTIGASGRVSPTPSLASIDYDIRNNDNIDKDKEELRCVIGVIRHGDRTPKQKMKLLVSEPRYLNYFNKHSESCRKDLKVKSKAALVEFLDITKEVVADPTLAAVNRSLLRKLKQIKDVLERWEISGINRKLQMKPESWEESTKSAPTGAVNSLEEAKVLQVLLILKWGGDLTPLGCEQAELLGKNFRSSMYPDTGGGMLRLHSTYRHDLKIKASDEGRVMKTAAAFAKGLLELEGSLVPILASLVTVEDKTKVMLDREGNREIKQEMNRCKEHLNILQSDQEMTEELVELIAPGCSTATKKAMLALKNPYRALQRMHVLIKLLCDQIKTLVADEESNDDDYDRSSATSVSSTAKQMNIGDSLESDVGIQAPAKSKIDQQTTVKAELYCHETLRLMYDRWEKLNKDFYSTNLGMYDLSKVPDIYDSIRYEVLHNSKLNLEGMKELYQLSMLFEASVVPQEYGIDRNDKRKIGSMMCHFLLDKIKYDLNASFQDGQGDMRYQLDSSHADDLEINTLGRCVRTRLYFTSESHLHTLLNVLRFAGEGEPCAIDKGGMEKLDDISELSYLTQVLIRLFEDREDPTKFRCEIKFSPGAVCDIWNDKTSDLASPILLNRSLPYETLMACLDSAIAKGSSEESLSKEAPDGRGRVMSSVGPGEIRNNQYQQSNENP